MKLTDEEINTTLTDTIDALVAANSMLIGQRASLVAERDELLFRVDTVPLRDYFAAHAMQALASDRYTSSMIKTAAEVAYDYADAMLEARK